MSEKFNAPFTWGFNISPTIAASPFTEILELFSPQIGKEIWWGTEIIKFNFGLEYNFEIPPSNVAIDWRPAHNPESVKERVSPASLISVWSFVVLFFNKSISANLM